LEQIKRRKFAQVRILAKPAVKMLNGQTLLLCFLAVKRSSLYKENCMGLGLSVKTHLKEDWVFSNLI